MNLHGKTLFITGASRGIGLAIARRAAAAIASCSLTPSAGSATKMTSTSEM